MKTLITNYAFDPANQRVTFLDYSSIDLKRVLLITNVTSNTMIYNFASPALGGLIYTLANNTLQLDFNTTSMSSTDSLQIFYDTERTPASDEVANALFEVARKLDFLNAVRGSFADLRVTPTATPNMSTLTTLGNIGAVGGFSANTQIKNFDNLTAIMSNINNIA